MRDLKLRAMELLLELIGGINGISSYFDSPLVNTFIFLWNYFGITEKS